MNKRHGIHASLAVAVLAVLGVTVSAAVGAQVDTKPSGTTKSSTATPSTTTPSTTSGVPVTEPLRIEHRALIPAIDALAANGDAVGVGPRAQQLVKVNESYTFLTTHLIPHAVAEDKFLYPAVDRLIGGKDPGTRSTDTMRRDHAEVGMLTRQLGALADQMKAGTLTTAQEQDLRQTLYSLHGIVRLHFAKEEEVYLPLLDRELTAAQAQEIFEAMEKATAPAGEATPEN